MSNIGLHAHIRHIQHEMLSSKFSYQSNESRLVRLSVCCNFQRKHKNGRQPLRKLDNNV